jgi:hypothetical protein
MKLYAGTTEQFRADARMHRIAEKLRTEYTTQIGHLPAPSEVVSWQDSLMALSMLVGPAELNDLPSRVRQPLHYAAARLRGQRP